MVEVAEPPCCALTEAGLAAMEKSLAGGGPLTVNETVVECVAEAPVPVTVSVYVPGVAVPELTVRTELPPEVTEAGLNEPVAPPGRPLTVRATLCAAPLVMAVAMVEVPLAFWLIEIVVGLALIEKSLVAVAPQPGNLNEPMRVRQLKVPFVLRYSVVYQKVQSSVG